MFGQLLYRGSAAIRKELQAIYRNWKYSREYYRHSTELLDAALQGVAIYEPWKKLDPGPEHSIDDRFAVMPALTKKDIRENFPRCILPADMDIDGGLVSGEISLVETSGTTDDKITNIWNQKWWDASEKASWKLNSYLTKIATGDHREAILVNPKNVGFISDNVDLPMEKRRLSRFLYLNEKTNPLSWSDELADRMISELNSFQPAVLEANPSYMARLSRYITSHNKAVFQPRIIVFTYEYPTIFHYRQIRQAFDVPMASSYGTTETGYVFMECENGKFHQNSDYCRVDFQPLKQEHGDPFLGRILVTPFNNPWSYMVRFDTGDLVHLEESGKCACGRESGMILDSISGRKANLTLTVDGRLVTLSELDKTMSKLKAIDEYQLIQTNSGVYDLHLVTRRTDKKELEAGALETLRQLYGDKAKISVIFKHDIPPENSGKYLISKALFPIDLESYLE